MILTSVCIGKTLREKKRGCYRYNELCTEAGADQIKREYHMAHMLEMTYHGSMVIVSNCESKGTVEHSNLK